MKEPALTLLGKQETGIPGFDLISLGGLPFQRTTLVSGTAGSAKTVFAAQFLAEGIRRFGQNGVFVTFEEPIEDIRQNMLSFGWPIRQWETEGRWAFVDASPRPGEEAVVTGDFDLGALLARMEYAVRRTGARRLSMDSLGAIFTQFTDSGVVRRELFRIAYALKSLEVTTVMTAERESEYGPIARFGVEEFVADNVVILRNILEEDRRRRTIEILKFRGTPHQKGEYPFSTMPDSGIEILPLSALELKHASSAERIRSRCGDLDAICGGGFFRDSIILVSGATGTGKTLTALEFLAGGTSRGEKTLFFAFEESREQIFRNASFWEMHLEESEKAGLLELRCEYPEAMGLDDHLIIMKRRMEDFRPERVIVDSLSALERIAPARSFREFIIGLTAFIKQKGIAGLFTSTMPTLMGSTSVTEGHISTITDAIILLRYVETYGEMRRGITVLKMRGSPHAKDIRELTIDERGLHIGKPFREISGVVSGNLHRFASGERADVPSEGDRL